MRTEEQNKFSAKLWMIIETSSEKNVFINNDFCFSWCSKNKQIIFASKTWKCNMKLSMWKSCFFKLYASNWEALYLGFYLWALQSLVTLETAISLKEFLHHLGRVASIKSGIIFLTISLVPLQSLDGSRTLITILEHQLWDQICEVVVQDGSNKFKKSIE